MNMNRTACWMICCLGLTLSPGAEELLSLSGEWKFSGIFYDDARYPLQALPAGYERETFDDSGWSTRSVPGNWRETDAEARNRAYMTGVYRRSVELPAPEKGMRTLLCFGGSAYDTTVYINGKQAGFHRGAFAAFELDITPCLRPGLNQFTIRCDFTNDKTRRAVLLVYPFPGDRAGLWGPLHLVRVPETYIEQVLIDPEPATGSLRMQLRIRNQSGRELTLPLSAKAANREGAARGTLPVRNVTLKPGFQVLTATMKLQSPELWSPEHPELLNLTAALGPHTRRERFGFSRFQRAEDRFLFNGRPIFLAARYIPGLWVPNAGVRRWAAFSMPEAEQKKLLRELIDRQKPDRVNMLRTHPGEPGPKWVYDTADEAGILIYSEWSNHAVGKLLRDEYLDDCIDEMLEWLRMVYNNPSVVMHSLANESNGVRQQEAVYRRLKAELGDRFVICNTGGFLPLITGPVPNAPPTDVADIHNYVGMSFRSMAGPEKTSWQDMCKVTMACYEHALRSWPGEKLPLIGMENPGGNWRHAQIGKKEDYQDASGNYPPDAYLRAKDLSERQGALSLGAWDMKNASLAERFAGRDVYLNILNKIIKRSAEGRRLAPAIRGLCIDSADAQSPMHYLIYQPILVCSKGFDFKYLAGDERQLTFVVINDSPNDLPGGEIRWRLRAGDGKFPDLRDLIPTEPLLEGGADIGARLPAGDRREITLTVKLPGELPTGDYRLDLELVAAGKTVSANYYPCYIGNPADWEKLTLPPKRRIALWAKEPGLTGKVLKDFGVPYRLIPPETPVAELPGLLALCDALLVPPFTLSPDAPESRHGSTLRRYLESGGEILSLETRGTGTLPWAPEWELGNEGGTWYVDIGPGMGHEVFAGLEQHHFDSWNGNSGYLADVMVLPMNVNMLAAGACVQTDQLGAPVLEAKIGKGRVMVSQLLALARYRNDPAATRYLHSLLKYFLTRPVAATVKVLESGRKLSFEVDSRTCFYVDLRKFANRGFTEHVPGDGLGWSGQGNNDLRHIPAGLDDEDRRVWDIAYDAGLRDKQLFRGVPFAVIPGKENRGKSCIMLKGEHRPDYPAEVLGIPIGRKAKELYFLHTSCFGNNRREVARYVLHYTDGSRFDIPLRGGREIADWWAPRHLENAMLAWSGINPASRQNVGVYAFEFKNPHPEKEIAALDFISAGGPIPVLLAVTGTQLQGE